MARLDIGDREQAGTTSFTRPRVLEFNSSAFLLVDGDWGDFPASIGQDQRGFLTLLHRAGETT